MEESVELHHSTIRELIKLAREKYHADPRRVFLLAFSQACAYNYRFVFTIRAKSVEPLASGKPVDS